MVIGDTLFCKLTGKRVIIQKVIHSIDVNPMLVNPEKKVDKYLVRYWSKVQDKFFSTFMYPDELALEQPIFNFKKYDDLKK